MDALRCRLDAADDAEILDAHNGDWWQGEGDTVTARVLPDQPGKVVIDKIEGDNGRLSLNATDNCIGIAAIETLKLMGQPSCGVALSLHKVREGGRAPKRSDGRRADARAARRSAPLCARAAVLLSRGLSAPDGLGFDPLCTRSLSPSLSASSHWWCLSALTRLVSSQHSQGLPLGSGMGSSAASAAAAAWAVNGLFGCPVSKDDLVLAGLASEAAVSGYHADNVGPSLLGGFVLVRCAL